MQPHCTLRVFFFLFWCILVLFILSLIASLKMMGLLFTEYCLFSVKPSYAYSALQQGIDHKLRKIWRQIITLKTNVLGNDVIHFFFLAAAQKRWGCCFCGMNQRSRTTSWPCRAKAVVFLFDSSHTQVKISRWQQEIENKKCVTEITNRLSSQADFQDVQLRMKTAEWPIEFQHLEVAMMSGCAISPLIYLTAVEVTIRA